MGQYLVAVREDERSIVFIKHILNKGSNAVSLLGARKRRANVYYGEVVLHPHKLCLRETEEIPASTLVPNGDMSMTCSESLACSASLMSIALDGSLCALGCVIEIALGVVHWSVHFTIFFF